MLSLHIVSQFLLVFPLLLAHHLMFIFSGEVTIVFVFISIGGTNLHVSKSSLSH